MSPTFFIDVWSDVVCPFCYLGFRQLRDALSRFENTPNINVRYHAFELDIHAPTVYSGTLDEMLASKYDVSIEQARTLNARVEDSARELGMHWSLSRARPTNTLDAHRVIAHAATQEKQTEMIERLFEAYFIEGLLVSDPEVLATLALDVGVTQVDRILACDEYVDAVRHDENLASKIGISGVPAFILDGRLRISGAQGSEVILDALHTAWAGRRELPV